MSDFTRLASQFATNLAEISKYDESAWTLPFWRDINQKLREAWDPHPPPDFLNHPLVRGTMVVNAGGPWLEAQKEYLADKLPNQVLEHILPEPKFGDLEIMWPEYGATHSTVHALYHLMQFQQATKGSSNNVIEWGGGYGNLARLWTTINPNATYTIIDTALFCAVQKLYLGVTHDFPLKLITKPDMEIELGAINIVPVALAGHMEFDAPDVFVATWSLSESNRQSQDFVAGERDWFRANRLLLAYQPKCPEFPLAEEMVDMIPSRYKQINKEVVPVPPNRYCFATQKG